MLPLKNNSATSQACCNSLSGLYPGGGLLGGSRLVARPINESELVLAAAKKTPSN